MPRFNDPNLSLGDKYQAALREIEHLNEVNRRLRNKRDNLRTQVKQQAKCIAEYRNLNDKLMIKATGNEPVSNRDKRALAKEVANS